jgi:hypothetical protein
VIYSTPTTVGSYNFSLQVTSHFGTYQNTAVTAFGTFSINIGPPPLTIATTSLPGGTVGVLYSQAVAATGGSPPYSWQVTSGSLPGGLGLTAATGNIYGTPTAAGSFPFQVKVTDSQQASATGSFTIQITGAPLTITTSSLPAGTVGTPYPTTTLTATGGTSPYTWSVAPGSALPSGLTISSAGVISGTPTASGTFTVTLQVNDSAQATATRSYSITVAAAVPSITTQAPLAGGEVGVAYTLAFAATGGIPPYTWSISAGAAPSGLTLNTSTGSLTGTPTAAGTFNFTVQVTDSARGTANKVFAISVVAAVKIAAATPPGGVTGVSYTQQFAATGGVTPYAWSIASGSIPAGLSLSTTTGLLSGTPTTVGTYTFTIAVTDQSGGKDSAAYTIAVVARVAPLSITTQAPLPGGVVGVSYTQTFAATGGTSPYTWSVSTGALPTGLTLNASTGSLTGTPTAAGTFNFTLQVVDSAKAAATQAFTITVTAALTITTATLPNGTVGSAYSQTLTATGGSGTLTWSSTGALPAGLTLSSAGSLSGTPSAPGTFTFTVGVTGVGQTATHSFTITVGVPPGPPATITGLPTTATPLAQPALGISIPSAYPLAITGLVTLTFAPDSPSPDDPNVQFTTGGRTVGFTVAANSTQVVFSGATPGVQIGTVSGTITLTLDLIAGGIDITPSPAPSTTLVIPKSAPVIVSATVTPTTGGFNIVVVGYATSREMVSANIGFTAAAGVTLASVSATVPLATVFTTWYQNAASAAYGSQFSLTMPFTYTNSTIPLTSVTVQLTNAQGNSNSVSVPY